jgi:peptidoglycan/LPS O-acetylase OafA/YrhL
LIAIILLLVFKDSLYQGFWIGLIIADIIKNYTHRISLELSNTTYCLLFILFFYFSSYPHYVNQEFIRSTIYSFLPDDQGFGGGYPMLSAVLIFVLVASNNKIKGYLSLPVFQFFGHISYGLYTMHLLIIGSFSSWLFLRLNNLLGYNISFIIAVSIGFPIIVLAAYMSTKYVDNPSIRLANYIENKINRIDTALLIKNLYNTKKFITKRST